MGCDHSCEDCGYKSQKKAFLGKLRDWCCFHDCTLTNKHDPCQYYINETDVGFGKGLYFSLLSGSRSLTQSENTIYELIMKAIRVTSNAASNMDTTAYCTMASPEGLEAMFELGECYRTGTFTNVDEKAAFFYYKLAASQGHIDSIFLIALCYYHGIGVERNEFEAFRYLERAATEGHAFAGYFAGIENKKRGNLFSAKSDFKVAAKKGHAWAQCLLADIYMDEWVSKSHKEKSFTKGLFWFICAYLHGQNSPKASAEAEKHINFHVQHGYPLKAVKREISSIKSLHPQYLQNPKASWKGYSTDKD